MLKVTDHELANLIAQALHTSGSPGNDEQVSIEAAYGRAAAVMTALCAAGVIAVREEKPAASPPLTVVKNITELEE